MIPGIGLNFVYWLVVCCLLSDYLFSDCLFIWLPILIFVQCITLSCQEDRRILTSINIIIFDWIIVIGIIVIESLYKHIAWNYPYHYSAITSYRISPPLHIIFRYRFISIIIMPLLSLFIILTDYHTCCIGVGRLIGVSRFIGVSRLIWQRQ